VKISAMLYFLSGCFMGIRIERKEKKPALAFYQNSVQYK